MGTYKDLDEARELFSKDLFASKNNIVIEELREDGCLCSMRIENDHKNALGNVMGGAIFTLADFAFSVAANDLHRPSVSLDADIRYLNPCKGGVLYAMAKLIKNGKTTSVFEVRLYDDEKDVAFFSASAYKL